MATLTVRNLDADIVRSLRMQAAEHGRSAEAEHRAILKTVLTGAVPSARALALGRLAEFRRRTAGRGAASSVELLEETRSGRAKGA